MRAVCVFCGSSPGFRPVYAEAAARTGRLLAEQGLAMVFGGSKVGLMGAAADAALAAGGEVFGVLPRALARKELGWEPRVPLDQGLRKTIEWFRTIRLSDYRPPTPNY